MPSNDAPSPWEVFRERLPLVAATTLSEIDLNRIIQEAQRAWPGLAANLLTFARHLAERIPEGGSFSDLRTSDLYLSCACLQSIPAALTAFDRHCLADLALHLKRVDSSPAFVDEVRQMVWERLLLAKGDAPPRLNLYGGRGSLSAWVRVTALRIALDLKTRRSQVLRDDDAPELPDAAAEDPELELLRRRYRKDFESAVRDALASLDPHDRTLLRLHLIEGLSIDKLGALYQIGRSTAARHLQEARARLADEVRSLLLARIRLTSSETASLARVLWKELDISLRRIL